jgi:heptosyltransferase-2
LTVIANPVVAELMLHHPHCDQLLVLDKRGKHRGLGGFLRFCGELSRQRFDGAILLQNALEAAVMATLARIPRRAGYSTDGRGWLLTHPVPVRRHTKRLHHVEYYLAMLHSVGITGGDGLLRLACSAVERSRVRQSLGAGPWLAVNPGAAYGSAKRWAPQRFAAVATTLAAEFGLRVLILGAPQEAAVGEEVTAAMHGQPLNWVGKTSVREMMAALLHCRLLLTNDSGPMHVAAALGVPVVAIFGPTDPTTTSPFTSRARIVRRPVACAPCLLRHCPGDHQCMEEVTVEEVLNAARTVLGENA